MIKMTRVYGDMYVPMYLRPAWERRNTHAGRITLPREMSGRDRWMICWRQQRESYSEENRTTDYCRLFLTPEKALEYGLIDRVDSYQADDKDVQQRLMSRVQQLSGVIAQQKSFREQLESMRQQGGEPKPPVPTPKPEPEEKKLTNQLAKLFQNM